MRFVENPFPKTDLISPEQLAYFMPPVGSNKRYSMTVGRGLRTGLGLQPVDQISSRFHPATANSTAKMNVPLANIYPTRTDPREFERTNFLKNPPEGTMQGQAKHTILRPQGNLAPGLSFSTGIYQTGISPTSFF